MDGNLSASALRARQGRPRRYQWTHVDEYFYFDYSDDRDRFGAWKRTRTPLDLPVATRSEIVQLCADLDRVVIKGDDDPAEVMDVLNRYNFDQFLEGHKFQVLDGFPLINDSKVKSGVGEHKNLLRALLPLMPTYRVAEENIPPEYQWIDLAHMQFVLHARKGRFREEKCSCKNHAEPANDEEKVCAMMQLGSDVLCAKLFKRCMEHPRQQFPVSCAIHLLTVCPQLLTIPGFQCNIMLRLNDFPELANVVLNERMIGYLRHSSTEIIDDLRALLFDSSGIVMDRSHEHVEHFKACWNMACEVFNKELLEYRYDGGSFLHLVCTDIKLSKNERFYFIQRLVQLGFDPSEPDRYGYSAVDHVAQDLFSSPWSSIVPSRGVVPLSPRLHVLLRTLHAMLPHCKNEAIQAIKLPQETPPCFSWDEWNMLLLKVREPFLDITIFPRTAVSNLARFLNVGLLAMINADACALCEPLTMLVHRELRKGLDVDTECNLPGIVRGRYTLLEWVIKALKAFYKLHRTPADPTRRTQSPGCCLWGVLELIVHCRGSLGELTVKELFDFLTPVKDNARFSPANFDTVKRVIRMLSLYAPQSKPMIQGFIHKLLLSTPSAQDIAAELHAMLTSVPSMKTLTRICITRNIRYSDAPELPLPKALCQFVQTGELFEHLADQDLQKIIDDKAKQCKKC